tara:strand:+ start:883 stop:1239 length:357 start_codon:yes stop_codon:yes gene_type:complete
MSSLCPAKGITMTVQEDMPHPDKCGWCREARNCSTTTFESRTLVDPLPQPDQTIGAYYEELCECGHQTIPSFEFKGRDIPEWLPHTKLCKEHTIRWMQEVINLKMKFNPEEYGEPITT